MEKDIGKIPKKEDTSIVVRIDDFGGRVGVTIREYVENDRYTGFTKAGTRIPASEFKKFKELINSINEEDLKEPEQETIDEALGEVEKKSKKKKDVNWKKEEPEE